MKINWKVRFKNKTWLIAFLAAIVAFVYQIMGMFGIVPVVSEDMVTQFLAVIINALVAVGVVIDPTTASVNDSKEAMEYKEPRK